jgi:alkylhydroperoxidase/carboxymuconolactone decarboxylase family protein YurZ
VIPPPYERGIRADFREVLSSIAAARPDVLEEATGLRADIRAASGLDSRTFALIQIATLIALDAPPASYSFQIARALEEGVTPEEILGVLRAVAPQVGGPKVVAASPEIMLALGLPLDDE